MAELNVTFPKGTIVYTKTGKAKIEYNPSYVNKFNKDLNKTQAFLDETVARYLSGYVSFKTGTQAKSIVLASEYGSGSVTIAVPYASYQAYSPRIKKRVGKRGTYPFERMKGDKASTILKQVGEYARRLNNG